MSDTHLCCKEERLDALHAQYDLFVQEGISTVFHAGNIVDGYVARINGDSVFETTIDGQAQYVVDNYPQRDGITTNFITGDDHESWFAPGFNFGAYLDMLAKSQGRTDLNYIGHVEADAEIRCGKFSQIIKIQHPGGGSAYARSYKGQKMVESFSGGEKPAILIQGHFTCRATLLIETCMSLACRGFRTRQSLAEKSTCALRSAAVSLSSRCRP